MIITCEACNTSFNLDDKMLKPTGSKVRCSICTRVFTAFPQQAPTHEPAAKPAECDTAPETKAGPETDFAAAAARASTQAGTPAPETGVLAEDADTLFSEGTDLDLALDDEPEDGVSITEIEDAVSDALEDDLADMVFDSETEPDLAFESDIDDESGATVIASLDDDDFELDLSPEPANEDGTATVIANLDDDLELPHDGRSDVAATVIADLDQEDYDLMAPSETDVDSDNFTTIIADLDDDALDLDSDFSLEAKGTQESTASVDGDLPETIDDLDDLNLTLDIEPEGDVSQNASVAPEPVDASLDDLSLDFDLEADADKAETASTVGNGKAVDDDLDLTLALDDEAVVETESVVETPALDDDLDLSSLESLLKDDEEGEADSTTLLVDVGEDSQLDLDLEDETPLADADAAAGPDETLEDLEFDLDGDGKPETLDFDDADDADQEIDLSEIEKMLEDPEPSNAKFTSVPEQDLDLDIEASLETEKWMSDSSDDSQLVADEELDLSELEQDLEDVDTDGIDDTQENQELELDLGDGEVLSTPTETVAVDNQLDFDLSDFEEAAPSKLGDAMAARESVDMDLEFEVEEGSQAKQTLEDEGLEETVAIPEPKAGKTKKAPSEPVKPAAPSPKRKPVKKGMSKSLVFLLIIAILGGGGYGTYYLLNQNGIDIPFLSDYLKPKVQDPGNLKLTTYDINSKFVDNSSVGKLFVISGKVKNGYAENRGMISLVGRIFSTGKVAVHQEDVYCGNIMSDLELANLEWDKIKARLSNRLGDNRSNVKIEPGKSIPFMVVFSGLPEDLEEFTIEVTGSTSLK